MMSTDQGVAVQSADPTGASMATPPRRLLTFVLEDYFQAEGFREVIRPDHWYRFEPRLVEAAGGALEFLGRSGVKATFFVSAWVADRFPALVQEVVSLGHEIALQGEPGRTGEVANPEEFRAELRRGRAAVERASRIAVVGYRVAESGLMGLSSSALQILVDEGFAYVTGQGTSQPRRVAVGESGLWIFPELSAAPFYQAAGRPWQAARGGSATPELIKIHTWEFDPDQPRVEAIPRAQRVRHYRNLGKTPTLLRDCFATAEFEGIAGSLGLEPVAPRAIAAIDEAMIGTTRKSVARGTTVPVSLVVPCYNEEPTVKYLANTLKNVRERLGDRYDLRLVLVDDGSTDNTWAELQEAFGGWSQVNLVRHDRNQGVTASILTGINHAETEIVCSIDCDCTYDPHELAGMVPLLTPEIDLVTASPYHPLGSVRNVQGARLFLSKSASFLYRRVFRQKLFTYTSCFRVYRRSAVEGMQLTYPGFLGMVEILGRLDLKGARVAEYPTTLEVRVFGQSKMKLARTILSHLGLLTRLLVTRLGPISALSSGVAPRSSLRDDAREFGYSPQKG